MPGWLTNGLNQAAYVTGGEMFAADLSNGLSASFPLYQLAAAMNLISNNTSKTMVASTRYYSSFTVGSPSFTAGDGGANETAPVMTMTGIQVLVGSTGGTDNWLVELHNAAGAVVANSALAGAVAGTAGTWQQFAFTSTFQLLPGTYFLVLQSNGTTAKFGAYNFPAPVAGTTPLLTGSATGTFGTLASITAPTTYTAGVGPVALPY